MSSPLSTPAVTPSSLSPSSLPLPPAPPHTRMAATPPTLVASTEAFVRAELASRDASHDFSHIDRVRKMAVHLAKQEGLAAAEELLLVEVAALLHDCRDWKYAAQGMCVITTRHCLRPSQPARPSPSCAIVVVRPLAARESPVHCPPG